MLQMKETWTNETKGHIIGDSGWYEPYTDNLGQLFRALQKEFGRCMSKVYQDTPDGEPDAIGWYFEKKREYEDADKFRIRGEDRYYIAGTWVFMRDAKEIEV